MLHPEELAARRRPRRGCASRWLEVFDAGVVAAVILGATHERALEIVPIEALTQHVALPNGSMHAR